MNDSVQKETEAKGTSVCRYCGKDTPHRHDFDKGRAAILAALDMQLLDRRDSEAAEDYLRTFAPPYPQILPAFSNTPGVPAECFMKERIAELERALLGVLPMAEAEHCGGPDTQVLIDAAKAAMQAQTKEGGK